VLSLDERALTSSLSDATLRLNLSRDHASPNLLPSLSVRMGLCEGSGIGEQEVW